MPSSSQIALYLWCAQPVLQSVVAVVLWRRGLRKKFPVFFTYILAQIGIFAITFPLRGGEHYEWFFYTYWAGAAVSALLGFRVIHEVFLDVFRPYDTLKDLGTVLFKWAAVVMLLVSVVVAFSTAHGNGPWKTWEVFLIEAITSLQRSVRLVQTGLILFLLLFSSYLGVSRRQTNFGIALGFGLFASIELLMLALYSGRHVGLNAFNMVIAGVYDFSIGVWLGYALAKTSERKATTNPLQTQRWEEGLAGLHTPEREPALTPDSLIPMFESMVERAFSRTSNATEPANGDQSGPAASSARAGSNSGD